MYCVSFFHTLFPLHKSVLSLSLSTSTQHKQQQQQHEAKGDHLDVLNDRIESLEKLVIGLKEEVRRGDCVSCYVDGKCCLDA